MSVAQIHPPISTGIRERVAALDWSQVHESLRNFGWASTSTPASAKTALAGVPGTGPVLTSEECRHVRDLYGNDAAFRSKIVMARHRFGVGEYKYFSCPLPQLIKELRESLYTPLAQLANEWSQQLHLDVRYPTSHREFIQMCHARGQKRPTPLLLRYERGGYNCLHQDLYGEIYFPLQTVFLLDQPGHDFEGGEFVLVEQRPRAQSAVQVMAPKQGEGIIFTTRWRPVSGTRGYYRVNIKHGVSTITRGIRHTMGIVYHDAE
jgi:hypothetical protein